MLYTIYKTTNKINGKIYIGAHKTKDLDDGYLGSGKHLGYAIEKYGKDNFKKEILAVFNKASEMFEMESELVNENFIKRDDTYNLKTGGEGGWDWINSRPELQGYGTEKFKELIKNKTFKKIFSEKCKIRAYKGGEASRNKAVGIFHPEFDKGAAWRGKKHSEATKNKIGKANSKYRGESASQYGSMWITNLELKKNRKIKKGTEIPEGWIKGRKIKF